MIKKWVRNELFNKAIFTLMMVVILELGRQISLPGVDVKTTKAALDSAPFFQNLANITGGQYDHPALFSIGLAPYMTGMILFQAIRLLDIDEINKLSEHQIGMVQRFISFVIGMLQSFQMTYLIRDHVALTGVQILGFDYNLVVTFTVLVAGAMIVAWMSDMMVKNGIGGSGVLILPGLISNMPRLLVNGQGLETGSFLPSPLTITIFGVCALIVVISSVFMNRAELRIPLQRPMVQSEFSESYLPMRVLAAGSMPFMFSTSIFMIPSYLLSFGVNEELRSFISRFFTLNDGIGIGIYCGIVVLLGYAFGFMNFRPESITKRLKKSGDYILEVAPGLETHKYLNRHLIYLTTIANLFFLVLIGTPLVIGLYVTGVANFAFVFSNLLILVTIIETTMEQIKALYLRTQYHLLDV